MNTRHPDQKQIKVITSPKQIVKQIEQPVQLLGGKAHIKLPITPNTNNKTIISFDFRRKSEQPVSKQDAWKQTLSRLNNTSSAAKQPPIFIKVDQGHETFQFGNRRQTVASDISPNPDNRIGDLNLKNPNFLRPSIGNKFETGSYLNRLSVDAGSSQGNQFQGVSKNLLTTTVVLMSNNLHSKSFE